MKPCNSCREVKPLDGYHKDPRSRDGHVNDCKECACKRARESRAANLERAQNYDRARSQDPARTRFMYGKVVRMRALYNDKWRARSAVANALRNGALVRQPCRECGAKAEAHHPDYSKPLDVDWLCHVHHRAEHKRMKEAAGAK